MSTTQTKARKKSRSPYGNVRKLPSGRYQARLTGSGDDGRNPFPGRTFRTSKEAYAALADLRSDQRHGRYVDQRRDQTLAEFLPVWMRVRYVDNPARRP